MKINSINSLMKFMLADHKFCLFRGQREARWGLESTLRRTLNNNSKLSHLAVEAEKFTLKHFTRSAHLYDDGFRFFNKCEFAKLTYIQHHGAPTRLLDLTASKFIALFFAFDGIDLSVGSKYARIWYFNHIDLMKVTTDELGVAANIHLNEDSSAIWNNHIKNNDKELLFIIQPSINSKRSHIQKGSFLCVGDINKSISEIHDSKYKSIIKFIDINKDLHVEVYNLLTSMNISHSTLYGGIDGFSNDVRNRLLMI